MFRNFFKIAYRNIIRNKGFSIINISGLAIGMASALLILLWVQNEMSYDGFYKNTDRLYQAWNRGENEKGIICSAVTPKVLGPALKQEFPEVEKATRVHWGEFFLFTVGEKKLNKTGNMVDPDFFSMFDFPFVEGDPNTALNNPTDIVITQRMSKELFDGQDAMVKTVLVDNKYNFTVNGVMKDLPNNTQFDFDYLLPWSHMRTSGQDDSSWDANSTHNYVLLKQGASLASVNTKIQDIIIKHCAPGSTTTKSFLYPVSRLRLYSNFVNSQPSGGKIETVKVFV